MMHRCKWNIQICWIKPTILPPFPIDGSPALSKLRLSRVSRVSRVRVWIRVSVRLTFRFRKL